MIKIPDILEISDELKSVKSCFGLIIKKEVEVFTQHEKLKIVSEFEYYNKKKENTDGDKNYDPFLE